MKIFAEKKNLLFEINNEYKKNIRSDPKRLK